jgi:tRNA A22 N-methylase
MADIGTDHGFLPIYLWQCGMCDKVIMTDVSRGSLSKAMADAEAAEPGHHFDFRLGNGLEVIEAEEVDDIVIAGMGGELIRDILSKDLAKTRTFKKFILQPRSRSGVLRYWLDANGFGIAEESIVEEGPRVCEIITAVPLEYGGKQQEAAERIKKSYGDVSAMPEEVSEGFSEPVRLREEPPDSIKWEVPYWTQDSGDEIVEKYISEKIERENEKLSGMSKGRVVNAAEFERVKKGIKYLRELLDPVYVNGR